jgi:hypothetical protein
MISLCTLNLEHTLIKHTEGKYLGTQRSDQPPSGIAISTIATARPVSANPKRSGLKFV